MATAADMKWVLIQGNGKYSIGTFDGVEFKEETGRATRATSARIFTPRKPGTTPTPATAAGFRSAWMRGSNFPDMPFNQQ